MSVSPSYPGIYIQELPSSSHSIVPAPTSIAAFVGYSHPYKTGRFGFAQQLFSFTDYETYFGGLFSSGLTDASLPRAVYQFFLNGGSTAWVVGLQPGLFKPDGSLATRLGPSPIGVSPTLTIQTTGGSIVFSSLEPIDAVTPTVALTNIRPSGTIFDITVTFGTQIETYRGAILPLSGAKPLPTDPNVMINGVSKLVTVAHGSGGWGTALSSPPPPAPTWSDVTAASGYCTGYSAADFLGDNSTTPGVFAPNSTLDNVEIFNLLLIPGIADNSVVSAALAFAERKRAFAILDPPPQAPRLRRPPPPRPRSRSKSPTGCPAS